MSSTLSESSILQCFKLVAQLKYTTEMIVRFLPEATKDMLQVVSVMEVPGNKANMCQVVSMCMFFFKDDGLGKVPQHLS